ncbi:tRNA dihydrouridine synthase DusB [Actinotignum urinale]|uniref:tRNA dihydrouridine synthase DusB n=2 Tax=Actinotignum urinale TaxID=190146 RepID=UPI0032B12D8D
MRGFMDATATFRGIHLGDLYVATPVMLAPMAGVTNPPFRQLCREEAEKGLRAAGYHPLKEEHIPGTFAPAGLWVCEMITSRALVERERQTMTMIEPDPLDPVRSIQLYGVEPKTVAAGIRMLISENRADHIDLNFGCPAPKVTRKGGGSALPWKLDLYEELVTRAVEAAREASKDRDFTIPVTIKFRIGIDGDHETFKDTARIAEDAGIVGFTLHARTTAQHYAGQAQWQYIADLVGQTALPVLGNGDIFEAEDAKRCMQETGCCGVAVGRGAQGRPWIFHDIAAMMHGSDALRLPGIREVAETIIRHAELSIEHFHDENRAMRELRKHIGWYLRGYAVGGAQRQALGLVSTLDELKERLGELDLNQGFPDAAHGARGRAGREKQPRLPDGWLDSRELSEAQAAKIHEAEVDVDGG